MPVNDKGLSSGSPQKEWNEMTPSQLVDECAVGIQLGREIPLDEALGKIDKLSMKKRLLFLNRMIEFGSEVQLERLLENVRCFTQDELTFALTCAATYGETSVALRLAENGARLRIKEIYDMDATEKYVKTIKALQAGQWQGCIAGRRAKPLTKGERNRLRSRSDSEMYYWHDFTWVKNDDCIISLAENGYLSEVDISALCVLAALRGRVKLTKILLQLGANPLDARPVSGYHTTVYWLDDLAANNPDKAQMGALIAAGIPTVRSGIRKMKAFPKDKWVLSNLVLYARPSDVSKKTDLFRALAEQDMAEEARIVLSWPGVLRGNNKEKFLQYAKERKASNVVALLEAL